MRILQTRPTPNTSSQIVMYIVIEITSFFSGTHLLDPVYSQERENFILPLKLESFKGNFD